MKKIEHKFETGMMVPWAQAARSDDTARAARRIQRIAHASVCSKGSTTIAARS